MTGNFTFSNKPVYDQGKYYPELCVCYEPNGEWGWIIPISLIKKV